jgi:hypothetical protein
VKGKGHHGGGGEPGQGLADGGGAREDLSAFVDQVKLFKTPLPREAPKTSFQVGFLKRNQVEPLCPIPPVDPPGEAPSETSVAVVDHNRLALVHLALPVTAFDPPGTTLRNAEQPLDLAPVKADDHLAIDDRDRSRPHPELQQFLQRLGIVPDILRNELHALLRKKLFLLVAGASPRLGIDNHLLHHDLLLVYRALGSAKREPKISRPASKASSRERTTPSACPFTLRQASRW